MMLSPIATTFEFIEIDKRVEKLMTAFFTATLACLYSCDREHNALSKSDQYQKVANSISKLRHRRPGWDHSQGRANPQLVGAIRTEAPGSLCSGGSQPMEI
jgi:hypothetical protein